MRVALTRRTDITNFDGVNRFIALLAEALAKLGHDPFIVSLCNGVKDEVKRWFKEAHGLNHEIPIYTLRQNAVARGWWRRGTGGGKAPNFYARNPPKWQSSTA
jgi:pterin-4a-carbinolamine dehydratase